MPEAISNYIIWWTSQFPLDREYRMKYNIPFGSKKHNNTSQIDVVFDLMETTVWSDLIAEFKEEERKRRAIQEGVWLSENTLDAKEEENDFFNTPLSELV